MRFYLVYWLNDPFNKKLIRKIAITERPGGAEILGSDKTDIQIYRRCKPLIIKKSFT